MPWPRRGLKKSRGVSRSTRRTKMTKGNVVTCLGVLIHQNCVQAFHTKREATMNEPESIITYYMALFDNIMHKSRAPIFLQFVSDELGSDCLGIFMGLVQHGRLSLKQITERNGDGRQRGQ